MHKEVEDYIKLQRKLFVLKYATFFNTKKEAYLACGVPFRYPGYFTYITNRVVLLSPYFMVVKIGYMG